MAGTKTEILTVLEFDASNGQEIIRPLTENELTQIEKDKIIANSAKAAEAAKAAARQSALAKLAELGLTEEEIAAL